MTQNTRIPTLSLVFGFGPMVPFVLAALGIWILPPPWPGIALTLVLAWGALILTFIAGVRRGFGFERDSASTWVEIGTMIPPVILSGLGLLLPPFWGLLALAAGFTLATVLDTRAARRGNAPAHFARLRPMQFPIAIISLIAIAVKIGPGF